MQVGCTGRVRRVKVYTDLCRQLASIKLIWQTTYKLFKVIVTLIIAVVVACSSASAVQARGRGGEDMLRDY